MSIFLPIATQELIFCYLYIIFAVSSILNVIGLFFLLKQTPHNQAIIRNYLIVIQVLLLVIDLHLEIGYHPIPLFPALAGYATGLLIRLGVSVLLELAITIALYVWIGMMILNCILYRHQNILLEGNPFKMRKRTLRLIQYMLIIAPTAIPFIFAIPRNVPEQLEWYLIENNLTWIKSRGAYHVEEHTPLINRIINAVAAFLILGSFTFVGIFIHMFYILRKDSAKRSLQVARNIRRSLTALFCQLVVPILFYVIPTLTIFMGLRFENLISFEVSLLLFLLLPWHSIGHNIILLMITPTYRTIIITSVKRIIPIPLGSFHTQTNKISAENGRRCL